MSPHRRHRGASHPTPRRSERDPCDEQDRLLVTETSPEQMTAPVAAPARERAPVAAVVPCVLALLTPGLGHFYLGKKGRAAVFFFVVLSAFSLGLASGGTASLIDPQQPLSYLATFDNLALGPLDLVGRMATVGGLEYRLPPEEGNPRRVALMNKLRERVKHPTYEYGNTFLLTAGLMNILLILDAFDIAAGRKD
jgi:Family of unknown function (DUF6677)